MLLFAKRAASVGFLLVVGAVAAGRVAERGLVAGRLEAAGRSGSAAAVIRHVAATAQTVSAHAIAMRSEDERMSSLRQECQTVGTHGGPLLLFLLRPRVL